MTLVDLTTFALSEQIGQGTLAIDAASLYCEFEKVKDGRGKKGKRYPLALILTLIMLGKMAGVAEIDNIIAWLNERKRSIKQLLGWPKGFPSHKTYVHALSKCDHREVVKAIAQAIVKAKAMEKCGDEPSRLVIQEEQNGENLIHTADALAKYYVEP